jgi:hypothetical protein
MLPRNRSGTHPTDRNTLRDKIQPRLIKEVFIFSGMATVPTEIEVAAVFHLGDVNRVRRSTFSRKKYDPHYPVP